MGTELEKAPLLEKIKEADLSHCALFLGAGVDPDGLASQFAMSLIIKELGGESISFYRGAFDNPQNRTMKELLALSLEPEESFVEEDFSCVISLDGPAGVCPCVPDFIIDHHEQDEEAKIGSDVRSIGSASAILWEYVRESGIDFEEEIGKKIATAISIGIMTDTRLGAVDSSSNLDFEALSFCLEYKDDKLYREILNYPKPAYYHDMHSAAWTNREVEGTVLVSGVGNIPKQRVGVIPLLAEQFYTTEGVNTAIIVALVEGTIQISVRSSNSSINMDNFIKTAFGEGGGKRGAGGAQIQLPSLLTDVEGDMASDLFNALYKIIAHKALQIAGDGLRRKED